jgi:hypothetical protein
LSFSSVEALNGGADDDHFVFGNGATIGNIDGRGGDNTADYTGYLSDLLVALFNGTATGVNGGLTFIQNVIGGSGHDNLTGDDESNTLDGGAGDDNLWGLGGNDFLYAGSGFNNLYGGDGYDTGYYLDGHFVDNKYFSIENFIIIYPVQPVIIPVVYIYSVDAGGVDAGGGDAPHGLTGYGYILVIPVESDQVVELMCVECLAIILRLPEGNQVNFGLGNGDSASLTYLDYRGLPGALSMGDFLVYGMGVNLFASGQRVDVTIRLICISFVVPEWLKNADLAILYWDAAQKAWIEVPSMRLPASLTGDVDRLEAWVKQTGMYIMVVRGQRQP